MIEAVEREVLEETGVEVKFDTVIAVRQVSGPQSGLPQYLVVTQCDTGIVWWQCLPFCIRVMPCMQWRSTFTLSLQLGRSVGAAAFAWWVVPPDYWCVATVQYHCRTVHQVLRWHTKQHAQPVAKEAEQTSCFCRVATAAMPVAASAAGTRVCFWQV